MGRHAKTVISTTGIDRRESGYYSTPRFVADFLSREMLAINPNGKTVLDPCVGKEELLDVFSQNGKTIQSFDIVDYDIHSKAIFTQQDFLEFYIETKQKNILTMSRAQDFDYYIANPPYNCHETDYIRNNKSRLQAHFPEIGVTNMYSMFISAIIDLAKDGALIGLITLDSFLTAGMHEGLRAQILDECSVHQLHLCPTDLFLDQKADVRTCLLILQKGKQYQKEVSISNRVLNKERFQMVLESRLFEKAELSQIVLCSTEDSREFVVGCPPEIKDLFLNPRLGQVFRCVTGISTGNDSKYISKTQTDQFTIPFFKNPGLRRFYTEADGYLPSDFLEIDKKVKNFMVRNKDLLFQEGITCSSMGVPFSACYLPENSTFGVNPNIICPKEDIWWLIGYLNSSLVTYFVRGILLRTNMITSGYVSRIPLIKLSKGTKEKLAAIAKEGFKSRNEDNKIFVDKLDQVIFDSVDFTETTRDEISRFCSNLLKYT